MNTRVENMAKDKLNQENIEVNQSKESGTKVTSEKATIFSYLSDINSQYGTLPLSQDSQCT